LHTSEVLAVDPERDEVLLAQQALLEGLQSPTTSLLESPADRRLAQAEPVEKSRGDAAVVALRETRENGLFQALVNLDGAFHLLIALKRTFPLGLDVAHTGHVDRHALAADADRTGIRAPAPVTRVERLVAAVARAAESDDLLVEDLASRETGQFGVVLQEMELDVESAAQHLTEASGGRGGRLWRKWFVCRIVERKLCFHRGSFLVMKITDNGKEPLAVSNFN
jgi:hypothetical protein